MEEFVKSLGFESESEFHTLNATLDISNPIARAQYLHWDNIDVRLNVFNSIPNDTQGLAVSWGVSDSPFRDDVFVYLVEKLYGLGTKEYYKQFDTLFTDEFKIKNTEKFK